MASNGKAATKSASIAKGISVPVAKGSSAAQKSQNHCAAFGPPRNRLGNEFVESIAELEQGLGMPVLLFIQDAQDVSAWGVVSHTCRDAFIKNVLPDEPVALVIDSLGGLADCAFMIANTLRRRCGGFKAVIPRRAKSAATLLAMGADEIVMAPESHLGPLDAQVFDFDSAERKSALEVVQAVAELRSEALSSLEETALMLKMGTNLPFTKVLPFAIESVSGLMKPLIEKVDVAEFMRMSRSLKVGEEYATQLMVPQYGSLRAKSIASQFVRGYPDHGFIITPEAAATAVSDREGAYGLNTVVPNGSLLCAVEKVATILGGFSAYGPIRES